MDYKRPAMVQAKGNLLRGFLCSSSGGCSNNEVSNPSELKCQVSDSFCKFCNALLDVIKSHENRSATPHLFKPKRKLDLFKMLMEV